MSEMYTMTFTREQIENVARACEVYGRLRNGQFSELTLELSLNPHKQARKFDRDQVDLTFVAARHAIFPELSPNIGHHYGVGHDYIADVAYDTYEVIRHALAYHDHPEGGIGVDFREPMCWANKPLPKIEEVRSEEAGN